MFIVATGLQRVLRKTEDVRRELKWKSDAEAAAAAAAASAVSSTSTLNSDATATTEHQLNVVRSCISRLRRGSELKTRLASRLPKTAKPASVEEEQEHGGDDVMKKADDVTSVMSQARGSLSDVSVVKTSKSRAAGSDGECDEMAEIARRRQRVLAMLCHHAMSVRLSLRLSVCLSHSRTVTK